MPTRNVFLLLIIVFLIFGCSAPASSAPLSEPQPAITPALRATKEYPTEENPTHRKETEQPTTTSTPLPTLESPIRTQGPYFLYFREADGQYQLVIMDADGMGRKVIPFSGEFVDSLANKQYGLDLKFVSPDGKWFVFYTGFAGDWMKGMQQGTFDLQLNLLDLTTGEKKTVTPLLSPDYPNNFVEAASKLNDSYITADSLFDAFINGIKSALAWSPDGRYLAFAGQMDGLSSDLYVYEVETGTIRRLSSGDQEIQWISWSPDGKWIVHGSVYSVGEGMTFDIYVAAVDGSSVRYLSTAPLYVGVEDWLDSHSYFESDASNGPGTYGLRLINIDSGEVTKIWNGVFMGYQVDSTRNWLVLFAASSAKPGSMQNEDPNFTPGEKLINLKTLEVLTAPDPLPDPLDVFIKLGDSVYIPSPFNLGNKIAFSSPDSKYWVVATEQELGIYSSDLTLIHKIPMPNKDSRIFDIAWSPNLSSLFIVYETDLYSMSIPDGVVNKVESNMFNPYGQKFLWINEK